MTEARQKLRITQVESVASQVRRYRLEPAGDSPLAPFEAGQYINLFYKIDGSTTSRPYSIASSPRDGLAGFYDLYIHGSGPFTAQWLFQHGRPGTELWASRPMGEFRHRPERDGKKLIGISGGMSVTPLRSMARAVVDGTLDADLTLFCGWDRAEEVLYREEFRAYEEVCPRFRVVFVVAEGAKGCETGYVSLEMVRRYVEPAGAAFFLCGPAAMYTALDKALLPCGIPPEKYHRELPGEVRDDSLLTYPAGGQKCCALTVTQGGVVHVVTVDRGETVLVALERAGLNPPARCRSGVCGFCGALLASGQVFAPPDRETRTEQDLISGLIHPCCTFPLTDLVLTLPEEGPLDRLSAESTGGIFSA